MISSDALFERTAKLPRVDIRRPQKVIGSSTISAMQSGLYHGFVGLVDGVLRKMIEEIGSAPRPARVIATGGLASLIATGSEFIELVDDTLTLEGLRLVYERTSSPRSKVQSPSIERHWVFGVGDWTLNIELFQLLYRDRRRVHSPACKASVA